MKIQTVFLKKGFQRGLAKIFHLSYYREKIPDFIFAHKTHVSCTQPAVSNTTAHEMQFIVSIPIYICKCVCMYFNIFMKNSSRRVREYSMESAQL